MEKTNIKDIKLYLVSHNKELCFYWEKYFGSDATVVYDSMQHFYSVNKDCEGFTFTGSAEYASVALHTKPWKKLNNYKYGSRDFGLLCDLTTRDRLNEIIDKEYRGLMPLGGCIATKLQWRFTADGREVYALYTPECMEFGGDDYVNAGIVFQCMFNTVSKAAELGLQSVEILDWGKRENDPNNPLNLKQMALTMKNAYDFALKIDQNRDPDYRPTPHVPVWGRTVSLGDLGVSWYEKFTLDELDEEEIIEILAEEQRQKNQYIQSKARVLNLHGLYGNADNAAYRELLKILPAECVEAPQIAYETTEPYEIFRTYLDKEYDLIVGTSFGGFYALVLGALLNVPTVVMNPCVPPEKYIPGLVPGYEYTEQLQEAWDCFKDRTKGWRCRERDGIKRYTGKCIAILGTEDELLDAKLTEEVLPVMQIEKIAKGHRMNDKESMELFRRCVEEYLDKKLPCESRKD